MKAQIHFLVVFSFLFAASLARGDEAARIEAKVKPVRDQVARHEQRIKALESSVKSDSENQNKRLDELKSTVDQQTTAINQLIGQLREAQEKLAITAKTIDEVGGKTEGNRRWVRILRSVMIPVALIVLAVVGFAFWPRKTVAASSSVEAPARPKCPRCGWEHDPDETICKNCKIQF